MRRLFNVIFQLLAAAFVIFLFTAVWIVFDGLNDQGEKADVALVTGHAESPQGHAAEPRLDRVVQLYNESEFPFIIVSGSTGRGAHDDGRHGEVFGKPRDSFERDYRRSPGEDHAGDGPYRGRRS